MKCPKCGFISFDFNDRCPKCNRELKDIRDTLILFPFKPNPINWLEIEELEPEQEPQIAEEKEEIELEQVSLDSLVEEKEEELSQEEALSEEEEEIEIEPVDLKSLEQEIEKARKESKEKEKEEIELEPIDLENLEIELEEEK